MLRLLLTAAAAAWLGFGTAYAQTGGVGFGSPPIGGSGIPMGATGLADPGLSPAPNLSPGPAAGTAPMSGIGVGGVTMPGLSGSSTAPTASTTALSPPVGAGTALQNTITNYGFAGMQRPPGSPPVVGSAIH